jgi:hypothetical protein
MTSNTQTPDTNIQEGAAALATLSHHADELQDMQDHAELTFPRNVAGNVVTEKRSKIGVGVIQLVVVHKDQTYRIKEAMIVDLDEVVENAQWIEVKPNTTLRHLLSKYGPDLLGYDARSRNMTLEAFAFELFATSTKSVRILLRKETAPH